MAKASELVDESGRRYDQIQLLGLSGFGRHGVLDEERAAGQMFVADVTLHVDTRAAASADDLALTVDYAALSEAVVAVITGEPAQLLETLADRIAQVVLAQSPVRAVDVVVHKPQAPLPVPFSDVAVSVRRYAEGIREACVDGPRAGVAGARTPGVDETGERLCDPVESVLHSGQVVDHAPGLSAVTLDSPTLGRLVGPPPTASAPTATASPTVVPPVAPGGPGQGAPTAGQPVAPPSRYVPDPNDPLDKRPARPVEAILALGANLGQAQQTLREAILEVNRTPGIAVARVSPLARTSPVGGPPQPDFLNIVLIVDTSMAPRELLQVCQAIETRHGRERNVANGPRTLDVDIIAYDNLVHSGRDLTIPHPRAHERAFVLAPWAHLEPNAILYGPQGGHVSELAEVAPDQSGVHYMALDWFDESLLDEPSEA